MRKREEKWRTEQEAMGKKYRLLLEEVKNSRESKESVIKLKEEDAEAGKAVEKSWLEDIEKLKEEIQRSSLQGDEASAAAK